MLPTMFDGHHGFNLYLRDCLSHRLVWLNFDHLKECFYSRLSLIPATQNVSFRRPWQRGDVVTSANPFTKYVVTKRIVGLPGDSVKVFGVYADEYHRRGKVDGKFYGVPDDPRFPVPYCWREQFRAQYERGKATSNTSGQHSPSRHETTITVPPNHVWVEGDNPLESTDSRHYGPLPVSSLRGRVILRLWPIGCTIDNRYHPHRTALISSERPAPPLMKIENCSEDDTYISRQNDIRVDGKKGNV